MVSVKTACGLSCTGFLSVGEGVVVVVEVCSVLPTRITVSMLYLLSKHADDIMCTYHQHIL